MSDPQQEDNNHARFDDPAGPLMARKARPYDERAAKIIAEGLPIGPRLCPCVCGAGRHAHLGKSATGGNKDTGCRRYRPDLAWELAYRALDAQAASLGDALREYDRRQRDKHYKDRPRKPGEWSIGASDAGACPKRIWYRNTPPEDYTPAVTDGRAARLGTMLHEEITRQMMALYPWRQFKVLVQIEGLDRQSEIDSYDPLTGEIEDYKSAGDWKWDYLGNDGPDQETWEQVLLYALAMEEQGHRITRLRLSYIKRENGHDETFLREWDAEARAEAEAARQRLLGYAAVLDMGGDLPRTRSGPSTDPLCRLCEARVHCWNMTEAKAAGRSPESYTVLGPDPDDEVIVHTIASRVEAQQTRLAAEREEKAAKVLMEGVEMGRYGDYEGYEKGGASAPDWQGYAQRLAEFYAMPEDQRPPIESIPLPQPKRYTYPVWSKVRKATLDKERRERAALEQAKAKAAAEAGAA